ncbi:unnamed protein product [Orchesella dallaii]|uniref:Uncharacterized protein n=1 Tax=Orchesella dallaii TaxID=48710 RepID=A0ABP1QMF1_9HEXA
MYSRKIGVTSQDLRKKLDARRRLQAEARQRLIINHQTTTKPKQTNTQPKKCFFKTETDDDDIAPVKLNTLPDCHGNNSCKQSHAVSNKSCTNKFASTLEPVVSPSPIISSDIVRTSSENNSGNGASSNDVAKKTLAGPGNEVIHHPSLTFFSNSNANQSRQTCKNQLLFNKNYFKTKFGKMQQYQAPALINCPKLMNASYEDDGQEKYKGFVTYGTGDCQRSLGPLLPIPMLKAKSVVGGAWKTYAQARTEERSATNNHQRHRLLGKNNFNSFNCDTNDVSHKIPTMHSTLLPESAAAKYYETMLASFHEFDRLCQISAADAAAYAAEFSPASFVGTTSIWGNSLMPVMPRMLPP